MNILKSYRCIFFQLYKWAEKLHGKQESPEFTAYFSLVFLVFANLGSLFMVLKLVFNFSIDHIHLSKYHLLLIALIPFIALYFLVIHKKKFQKILKEFEEKDQKQILKRKVLVWLYIAMTMIILFGLMIIQMKINEATI
ncbi:MAG TPA: hypothetical protein P5228_06275 [Bacteroidales bacterium]|nr:hypothetical protein [Bacteroidales bacterium]HRZ49056.1 hypothetical protein [Bacteroidales bacterium]